MFVYSLPSVPIYKYRNLEYNIILTADQIEATWFLWVKYINKAVPRWAWENIRYAEFSFYSILFHQHNNFMVIVAIEIMNDISSNITNPPRSLK